MNETTNTEQLTPLDLLMPNTYIQLFLTFQTTEPTSLIQSTLQRGLNAATVQLPWLLGRIVPTVMASGNQTLQIQWNAKSMPPVITNKGSVESTYEALDSQGMSTQNIPAEMWPLDSQALQGSAMEGAPVFAASIFRFANEEGLGLCICAHHHVFDATGLAELVRLWSLATAGILPVDYSTGLDRVNRLTKALNGSLGVASAHSVEDLWDSHPEFSRSPPAMPSEFPPCFSKLFRISMDKIEKLEQSVSNLMTVTPTTTNIVTAMLWITITRARARRTPALANSTTHLVSAVNCRQRVGLGSKTGSVSYFGNVVQYAMAALSTGDLQVVDVVHETLPLCLAKVCSIISDSQSVDRINSNSVAELCSLVNRTDDPKSIFPGWDLFSSRDLTVTSWNGLDIYNLDFGEALGKPKHIRPPYMEADGVGMIMPRAQWTRHDGKEESGVEVIVMLRRDDLAVLSEDDIWVNFTN
ncbi:unnamed protein product [Clonostachys rosea f. rosea IK726]|uniref:Uncharacterized protein n=1 Tax=Clonostachys rosea f. rosea IK726 TaxID=1349383 RepID=A0ACA9UFR5_BIOOC|nr:unnamed protein product [Clonostachys rosea f. rosea IK726]